MPSSPSPPGIRENVLASVVPQSTAASRQNPLERRVTGPHTDRGAHSPSKNL